MATRLLNDDEVSVPEAIARVLEEAGVDFVFGMPGGRTLPIYDALYDHSELQKALAHALSCGRPTVVDVVCSDRSTFRDVTSPLAAYP